MARAKGKVRKQKYRQHKRGHIEERTTLEPTLARTSQQNVRAVGDGRLAFVGKIFPNVVEQFGGMLPTTRVAKSETWLKSHVRSKLRARYESKIKQIIEAPSFAGTFRGASFQRLTLVKEFKSRELVGIGLDLAEDEQGAVYVVSTIRKERPLAIERRVEGTGRTGMTQRLKRVK
jgi:hypothetical protein